LIGWATQGILIGLAQQFGQQTAPEKIPWNVSVENSGALASDKGRFAAS
jgi:hypothetical protein